MFLKFQIKKSQIFSKSQKVLIDLFVVFRNNPNKVKKGKKFFYSIFMSIIKKKIKKLK
jgi:hypothetical protein